MKRQPFEIQVVGGAGHGDRIEIDSAVRTIGRAPNADLVLRDPSVSRRHLQVVAGDEGVTIVACGDASPFVVAGAAVREHEAKEGDRITVGSTTLLVVRRAPSAAGDGEQAASRVEVATLLTGVAEDTRAIAALHALLETLDRATETAAVLSAFSSWANAHARTESVEFLEGGAGKDPGASAVETREGGSNVVAITVPAPADAPLRVTFKCELGERQASASFRRMLVLAGRILGSAVARVRRLEASEEEVASLRALSFGTARAFLGTSSTARRVAELVPRLAASDASVLIEGETGVGKTFVARLIHEGGPRATQPLRIVNCAAIPENLAEAELFGHERGAFTGAVRARAGAFEAAGRGTILLDEIGELPLGVQTKLLRVLEDRVFERVGSNRPIALQARVLCATNRNLEEMIARREFRSDLFFRISVVRIAVPPLRERGEDLILLAQTLLADLAKAGGRRVSGLSADAARAIQSYPWPGNVRELRNALERAVVLGDSELLLAEDLPFAPVITPPQPEDGDLVRLPIDLATLEKRAVLSALRHTNGNRTKAAALLGVNRQTLYNKLDERK